MNTSRRTFLKGLAAGAGLGLAGPAAYVGFTKFQRPAAQARPAPSTLNPAPSEAPAPGSRLPAPATKALVVIQLAGGNDGLATVLPFADPSFKDLRPTLTFPEDQLVKLNDKVALHPNLKSLKPLWDQKKVAIVQGVGYPNPNRSHFASMDIWATASPDKPASAGWLGRYLDAANLPADNAFNAMSVGPSLPFALKSQKAAVASVTNADNFQLRTDPRHRDDAPDIMAAFTSIYQRGPAGVPYYGIVERVESTAAKATEAIKELSGKYHPAVMYPATQLGRGLQSIAQVLSGGYGTRVYYVQTGGFDTHANEKNGHDRLMTDLGDAIAAFYNDIKGHGPSQNVVMMTWSEFGRRVKENGSNGTDHGTAAPMFVIGDGVKGGLIGDHPSLTKLDNNGDLVFGIDFRSVYSTVLGKWLGMDGQEVLGSKFETLPLFA